MRPKSVLLLLPGLAAGCSAAEPVAGPDAGSRIYTCEVTPLPDKSAGPATFTALYDDLFAPTGVARCQSAGCHGGDNGQLELTLGWTRDEALRGLRDKFQDVCKVDKDCDGTCDKALCSGGPRSQLACTTNTDCAGRCDVPRSRCDAPLRDLVGFLTPGRDGSTYMPKLRCDNRPLNAGELARIDAWVKAGSKDD